MIESAGKSLSARITACDHCDAPRMPRRFLSSVAPSVRSRLWSLVLIVALPATGLTGWLIAQSYRSERRAMEQSVLETARNYSALLDAELRTRAAILRGLAGSPALRAGDLAAFRARAHPLTTSEGEWLFLTDEAGRVRLDTRGEGHTTTFLALAELAGRESGSGLMISNLLPLPGEARFVVAVAMKVQIGPQERGLLALVMTPETVLRLLVRNRPPKAGVFAVIDREHTFITRSQSAEKFVATQVPVSFRRAAGTATEGVVDSVTLEGRRSIAAFSVSAENGWMVAVAGLKSELLAPAIHLTSVALVVVLLVGGAVLALAVWVGRESAAVASLIVSDTEMLAQGGEVVARQTGVIEADAISRTLAATSRELAARQAAIARARDEAMAASRAKDEFLAALSHELRTPLNPVLLLASEAAHDPAYPPDIRQIFATIEKNVMHESRLIDDLLDVTRIAAGKLSLQLKPTDVDAALREALETLRGRATEKHLHLHVDLAAGEARVLGDNTRLQQIFTNVIGNAMKFTPTAGSVAVTSRLDRAGEQLVVEVSDSGLGLTADELSRIFERFSQGDHARQGRQSPFGGLGLGLTISKSLVELHGGKIEASSAGAGRGATFRIHLPLAPSPA